MVLEKLIPDGISIIFSLFKIAC